MEALRGKKILVTGPGGQVAFPIARELAKENQVIGLARFRRAEERVRLEEAGVRCVAVDLADDSLDAVPDDVDYVLHFAVVKSLDGNFDYDLSANAEGTGRLMERCRRARAFLYCSSTGVYEPAGHQPLKETDPLGDNHRILMPTYSISKIAAETMVRFGARQWRIPATIARLNVPYGANGGWPSMHLDWMLAGQAIPVHVDRPNLYNPIFEDDYIAHIPKLLEVASVPATIVNWAGSEPVAIEEWCGYLGDLAGRKPSFLYTDRTISSVVTDVTRMHELIGPTRVAWRDGMRRMLEARHPEVARSA